MYLVGTYWGNRGREGKSKEKGRERKREEKEIINLMERKDKKREWGENKGEIEIKGVGKEK